MEALLTPFLAAALGEWGDKTQLLAAVLAVRYGRAGPVLAGLAAAAFLHGLIASAGGVIVHGLITPRAVSLLVAVALLFAGVAGLIGAKAPDERSGPPRWPALGAAAAFFVVEFGDKTQFLTFSLAAQFDALLLAAAGAAAGVFVSSAPAALLGGAFEKRVPVRPFRYAAAGLFLLLGAIVAVRALRLV